MSAPDPFPFSSSWGNNTACDFFWSWTAGVTFTVHLLPTFSSALLAFTIYCLPPTLTTTDTMEDAECFIFFLLFMWLWVWGKSYIMNPVDETTLVAQSVAFANWNLEITSITLMCNKRNCIAWVPKTWTSSTTTIPCMRVLVRMLKYGLLWSHSGYVYSI